MKHAGPVRRELGFRTIFNLLGPLSNPARVRRQLIGVYDKDWIEPLAEVLRDLGTEKSAWVVHGGDGLDELTTTGVTHVAVLENGKVTTREVGPEDAGVSCATLRRSARAATAARRMRRPCARLFDGEPGAYRDIVLLNAAAALIVAGKAQDLRAGAGWRRRRHRQRRGESCHSKR